MKKRIMPDARSWLFIALAAVVATIAMALRHCGDDTPDVQEHRAQPPAEVEFEVLDGS